jgi:hypothetical protein
VNKQDCMQALQMHLLLGRGGGAGDVVVGGDAVDWAIWAELRFMSNE